VWDVEGMLDAMTWKQYVAWQTYSETDPIGEQRKDLRTGIIASLIANANRDSKKTPKPYSASDFIPKFGLDAKTGKAGRKRSAADAWAAIKAVGMGVATSGSKERPS